MTKLTSQAPPPTIVIPPGYFNTSDDITMTTATITKNQDNFYEMTLEEQIQQYDDEQYAVEDRIEEVVRLKGECEILAAVMDSSLFEVPIIMNTAAKKK